MTTEQHTGPCERARAAYKGAVIVHNKVWADYNEALATYRKTWTTLNKTLAAYKRAIVKCQGDHPDQVEGG